MSEKYFLLGIEDQEVIEDYQFKDRGYERIIIPACIKSLGEGAFSICSDLLGVRFEEGSKLTTIGEGAFFRCKKLTTVELPKGVTSIGKNAFFECKNLTSITIPNTVTSIGSFAFSYCTSLEYIVIPNTVLELCQEMFDNCSNLTSVYYKGTINQWGYITKNKPIVNAKIYYYSEAQPTTDGDYWHYNENGNPVVW